MQAFFQRWWDDQSDTVKSIVKKLINSGQLELMYVDCLTCSYYLILIEYSDSLNSGYRSMWEYQNMLVSFVAFRLISLTLWH